MILAIAVFFSYWFGYLDGRAAEQRWWLKKYTKDWLPRRDPAEPGAPKST